jgi:SAM-dependent methyltransferase
MTWSRIRDVFRGRVTSPVEEEGAPADLERESGNETVSLELECPGQLDGLSDRELLDWENRGITNLNRQSDRPEADADERQEAISSLNFPLHWTSATLAWQYLFDIAIAGELLGVRPDDRILDFASGTSWATELLARLGVRPVALDLSFEMMVRGRSRVFADSRLTMRNEISFVAGRGQDLPFVDESFDGVLCLNALHHQPSYLTALREIYRVLKPGGRAVFSEPGTAHAEAPLSAFRMREEGILEKSVSLPLVHRLAREAGFTKMKVVPLRSAADYVMEYSSASPGRLRLQEMWNDTLRHSAREHARFVLYKGDAPPADTLLPAHQLQGRLSALLTFTSVRDRVSEGEAFSDRIRVVNSGSVIWRARGRRFGGQVTLGLKVYRAGGELVREDLGRTPLKADVAPGEERELAVEVAGALPPGRYELKYDMVVEGVTWFEPHGSHCLTRAIVVTP